MEINSPGPGIAAELEKYFDLLWPVCRSITGAGTRESLHILKKIIPLELHEVPSGQAVFDWVVPREWNIRDAYILTPDGKKIGDFKKNNLHVLNYSIPVDCELSFEELDAHLYSIAEMPDAIPYRTSYYEEAWGFCLSHNERESLPREGTYKVLIDSSLENGFLTYGDLVLKGETDEEILLTTYVCHPSMANNELSGPLVLAFLYQKIAAMKNRRYTYRFVFAPETIGAIVYLNRHGFHLKEKLRAGYVVTCAGDNAGFVYKRSKQNDHEVNRVALHVLEHCGNAWIAVDFFAGGSDERQYCSPGFNLPVGSLMRSMYGTYKEYHTSLDNKDFVSFEAMEKTIAVYFSIIRLLELNRFYINNLPYCEPQLGKRGLYTSVGGSKEHALNQNKRMHLLSFADGSLDLVSIAEKRGWYALEMEDTIRELEAAGLLSQQG